MLIDSKIKVQEKDTSVVDLSVNKNRPASDGTHRQPRVIAVAVIHFGGKMEICEMNSDIKFS